MLCLATRKANRKETILRAAKLASRSDAGLAQKKGWMMGRKPERMMATKLAASLVVSTVEH